MPRLLQLILIILFIAPAISYGAPIYVYRESDGVIRFTTEKPPAGVNAKVFSGKDSGYSYFHHPVKGGSNLFTVKYASFIRAASVNTGLSTALIRAVIHAESSFNPRAISKKGAKGLMQLTGENLRVYGVRNPYSPRESIDAGTKLLQRLYRKYNGNVKLTLAAYNAGEGAVAKYRGVPPYKETQRYVKKVVALMDQYSSVAHG